MAAEFGLAEARLLLLTGSRAEGTAGPSADTDLLAIYDDDPPGSISYPGVIDMRSTVGNNWIGQSPAGEINVEAVTVATLERVGAALRMPLGPHCAPLLQEIEIRLLRRVHTGIPVAVPGHPAQPGLQRELRLRLRTHRLPLVVLVMNYCGAASYLRLAWERRGDRLACQIALAAVAEGVALATLALSGTAPYGMKNAAVSIRLLEGEHGNLPVRTADLAALLLDGEPEQRLPAAAAAMSRVHEAVSARAAAGDALCQEALRGMRAADPGEVS
jgi:hypothetical protein